MAELAVNPLAHLTEYELHHLAEHLETSERAEELHQLLALGTSEQHNAWWEARDAIGDTEGYLSDVARGWRLTEVAFASSRPSFSLGLQCRYALIAASINSVAQSIPVELILELVKARVWRPDQGITYALQIPDPRRCAEALIGLAPHLPASLLEKALTLALDIRGDQQRFEVLNELIPYLPVRLRQQALADAELLAQELPARGSVGASPKVEALIGLLSHVSQPIREQLLRQALGVAKDLPLENKYCCPRADALVKLIPHLSEKLLKEVLGTVQSLPEWRPVPYESPRGKVLIALASCLTYNDLAAVFAIAQGIKSALFRAKTLVGLIPYLPQNQRSRACEHVLAASEEIGDPHWVISVLIDLIQHLSDNLERDWLERALSAAQAIEDELGQAQALVKLAPYLNKELLGKALMATRNLPGLGPYEHIPRIQALSELALYLPDHLTEQALEEGVALAGEIKQEDRRVQALGKLIPHLPSNLVEQCMRLVRRTSAPEHRAEALAILVPHVPERMRGQVVQETLAAIGRIKSNWKQASVLTDMAPHLTEDYLGIATEICRGIEDEHARAQALIALAPHLTDHSREEVVVEAMNAGRVVGDEYAQIRAMVSLVQYLPKELLADVFERAKTARMLWELGILAPYIAEILPESAVLAAQGIRDSESRSRMLNSLALHLPDGLKEQVVADALAAAQMVSDSLKRVQALVDVASHLSSDKQNQVLGKALTAVWDIRDSNDQVRALSTLAPYLSISLLEEALLRIRRDSSSNRVQMMLKLFPSLPDGLKKMVLEAVWDIEDIPSRMRAFAKLAPHLSKNLRKQTLGEILETSQGIGSQVPAEVLIPLISFSSGYIRRRLLEMALTATQRTESEWEQARNLSDLAPRLSKRQLKQAILVAGAIGGEWERASALNGLIPHLSSTSLREVLRMAQQIENNQTRFWMLTEIALRLPKRLKTQIHEEALRIARQIRNTDSQVRALIRLASHSSGQLRNHVLEEILGIRQRADWESVRYETLLDLACQVSEPLRDEIHWEALSAAQQVIHPDGQAAELAGLALKLGEADCFSKSLIAARDIWKGHERARVFQGVSLRLCQLAHSELKSIWLEVYDGVSLLQFLSSRTRQELLSDLSALAPVIAALGGEEAIAETFRAIQDVGRWWP